MQCDAQVGAQRAQDVQKAQRVRPARHGYHNHVARCDPKPLDQGRTGAVYKMDAHAALSEMGDRRLEMNRGILICNLHLFYYGVAAIVGFSVGTSGRSAGVSVAAVAGVALGWRVGAAVGAAVAVGGAVSGRPMPSFSRMI